MLLEPLTDALGLVHERIKNFEQRIHEQRIANPTVSG